MSELTFFAIVCPVSIPDGNENYKLLSKKPVNVLALQLVIQCNAGRLSTRMPLGD